MIRVVYMIECIGRNGKVFYRNYARNKKIAEKVCKALNRRNSPQAGKGRDGFHKP